MNRACLRGLKRRGVFRRTAGYRLWKYGRVLGEKRLTRGWRIWPTAGRRLARDALTRKAFRSLLRDRSHSLVSQESLNYFASFEPRQRSRATRQPLHKVGSVSVNETPLRHFFVVWLEHVADYAGRANRRAAPIRDSPGL